MEHTLHIIDTALTKRIMRRVYLIATIRFILNPVFMKSLIAVVFFWQSTKYVSYVNVFANMPSLANMTQDYQFMKGALFHAHPMTIILLSSVVWLSVWVAFDVLSKRQNSWI